MNTKAETQQRGSNLGCEAPQVPPLSFLLSFSFVMNMTGLIIVLGLMSDLSTYVAKYLCKSSNRPEANDVENVRNFSAIIHARAFSYREGF